MLFKRIYDDDLAQAGYLIGCQSNGTAVVVDPRRDVQVYLDEAERNNMKIVAVTETHIHADYLSGARELAHATGATLHLSGEGGESWQYRFAHEGLADGGEIRLGNVTLTAVYTPGHTPEHLSFLVTDGAATAQPGYILTGDFVFVGDLGRPDLLGETAGGDTRLPMAKQFFKSLKDKFLPLPDFVQVWPGHGAGSACGRSLGAVDSSTVGYEKLVAWWSTFVQNDDEAGFVKALLEGQPDAPVYFSRMKQMNRAGPLPLGDRGTPKRLDPDRLSGVRSSLILIDTRARAAYERDAVKGALHLPAGKTFVTYASYVIDPEKDQRDIVLLARDEAQAASLRDRLSYVGIDHVAGFVTDFGNLERVQVNTVAPEALSELGDPFILDIRTQGEYEAGHLPEARRIHAGRVMWDLGELPKDRPLVTHCQGGARNTVVSSALRAAGFTNVVELEGSYLGWKKAQRERVDA